MSGRDPHPPPLAPDFLPRARAALWPQLPTLAAASVLVCLAAVVPLLIAPGISPTSLLVAAVTIGPAWAAVIATTDDIVHGGEPTLRNLLGALRYAGAGIAVAAVPAVPAALVLLAVAMYRSVPEQWWLLLPAGLAATTATLGALAAPAAYPLRITGGLRGRELWRAALTLTARAPAVPLGIAAVVFLGLLAGTGIAASLLLLLPGPVALLNSAGVWTTAGRHLGLQVSGGPGAVTSTSTGIAAVAPVLRPLSNSTRPSPITWNVTEPQPPLPPTPRTGPAPIRRPAPDGSR